MVPRPFLTFDHTRAVARAMQVLSKVSDARRRLLVQKLSENPIDNIDTTMTIINQLIRLGQTNKLDFDPSRTFKRQRCLKAKGYTFIKALGSGAFGQVSLVERNGKEYAIKRIPVTEQDELDAVQREIEIMKLIKGKGIGPDIHDYFLCKSTNNGNHVFLVMDHMNMGQVSDHSELFRNPKFQKQLQSKLDRLHAMGIKHNDLIFNTGNALFHKHSNGRVEIFISDFGVAETTKMWVNEETFRVSDADKSFQFARILGAVCALEGLIAL